MPRKQTLAAITPNRYYQLEATLKYLHPTETGTTGIIEQDNIQKRIKLPLAAKDLQEGAQYSFQKCFYSSNGWIRVDHAEQINLIDPKPNEFLNLHEIYEARAELNSQYVTTILQIVEVGEPQKKVKEGQELTLTLVKAFADEYLIDLTLWNRQMSADLLGRWMIVEGMRVKLLTPTSMVLVSTVYTKMHEIEAGVEHKNYGPQNIYRSLSQVYAPRTIAELNHDIEANGKSFSITTATVQDILIFDYEGCSKCRKKIEAGPCLSCGDQVAKGKFWVAQLLVKDQTGEMVVLVFDEKILGAFRLAKKGTMVTSRIKSTYRATGDKNVVSNVLTAVMSLQF